MTTDPELNEKIDRARLFLNHMRWGGVQVLCEELETVLADIGTEIDWIEEIRKLHARAVENQNSDKQ